jgi:spermidine/putrescine transport system substrate-binding protein
VSGPVDSGLTRRDLLAAGAGAALAAYGLAGCGIGRGIQGDVNRVIEPKVDGDLYYFNYSQYINPGLVKEFEKRYDVRVIQSYFDSMEGMMAKLRAGNAYDVMFPTAEYVQRLVQQEQLLRIPRDKLENIDNIYGYFDDPWYDPDSAHSVPYSLYITGIGYRADILDNMTGSWDDLGNEEAAGRIYVLDDYQEERMLRCVLEMAESLLDCELWAADYGAAAGNGSKAARNAVREAVPHLADTELRRGLE